MTTGVGRRRDLELAHGLWLLSPLAAIIFVSLRPPDLRENDWFSALSAQNRNNHLNLRNSRRRIDLPFFSQKLPFFPMLQQFFFFFKNKICFTTPFHEKFKQYISKTWSLMQVLNIEESKITCTFNSYYWIRLAFADSKGGWFWLVLFINIEMKYCSFLRSRCLINAFISLQ